MLRKEIQSKTGLTRKALEYYEEKGLIHPKKLENGYREYGKDDLEILEKIRIFRTLGLSITEMKDCISSKGDGLSSILRKKEHFLEKEESKKEILALLIKGGNQEDIHRRLSRLEMEETCYEKLEKAFPGYFGQLLFYAYQPFLQEPLDQEGEDAFHSYIQYLDQLPPFDLDKEDRDYIEKVSAPLSIKILQNVNKEKRLAVEHPDTWLNKNKEVLSQYESFKTSEQYQKSKLKRIQDCFQAFLQEHHYYEKVIPLIRTFSKSYDDYYKKLLKANEKYCSKIEKKRHLP